MVQNTKNNQPYWLENLKKAISYVNSEEFLNDLEFGKYDTDRNSIIYLNLEDGTVSTTPVFGATLKTVKLSFWNVQKLGKNNFSIQNGIDVTLKRFNTFVSDLISELTPTLKSKPHTSIVRGEYPFCMFDKIYQKKAWDRILVELFNHDFDYFGFDKIFNRKEISFKKLLSKDTRDLFFESFYCDDYKELTSRMFLYKKYNEISEEAAIDMLDRFKEKIVHQNKNINPENKDSYNSLFPSVDSKYKKQWFNSFYAQLVLPSHKVYKTFGVDYPKELDDITMSNTKLVLEWFDINSLLVGSFVGEMLEYIPEEKLSSFDVTVVLDSSTPTMLVSWDEKFIFSPSASYFDGNLPESDTFFDVPFEMAFDLLSKFKSVMFRLGDDVCEPSIWPEMTSKLIDFWVFFSKNKKPKFDFKVDDKKFTEYLKFGENDPKKFIYFNKKMNDEYFTKKKGMFCFEDIKEYYEALIKKIC